MPTTLITGASSGLGASLATELCRRGHPVGLIARRAEMLEALAEQLRNAGGTVAVAAADVTQGDALDAAVKHLEDQLGPTEVMIANAGVSGRMVPTNFDLDAVRHTFEVNVFGAMASARAVLPAMLARRKGHLVVISSMAANRGLKGGAPYSASKAAISTFWEAMRQDLAGTGVTTGIIHPGFVDTPMTQDNAHPMPFMISPERAATLMADAIEKRRMVLTYPWQMAWVEPLMRVLPVALYDAAMARSGR